MTSRYLAPVPFADDHDVSAFECRSREQTDRLRRDGQAASTDTTRVFVTEADASAVDMRTPADTWPSWRQRRHRHGYANGPLPYPVALLRLGVDVAQEGRSLATALAPGHRRSARASDDIGCRGSLVHAESAETGDGYRHLIPRGR